MFCLFQPWTRVALFALNNISSSIFHPQHFILTTKESFLTINLDKDIAMLESLGSNLIFPKWTNGELEHQSMLESMTA